MPVHPDNLAWIDLEMTGLDPEVDRIIEIATIVTDKELRVLAEGPSLVVHQPDALLDAMDEWNTRTHGESGLTQRVRDSRVTEAEAEERTLAFLSKWVGPRASPICGNSVHQDRRFLVRYMPRLEAFFHYRNVDVSTLKELAKRWAPDVAAGYTKESVHLALEDIRDSIRELQYYREKLFR
jgi:oligoribonuclease